MCYYLLAVIYIIAFIFIIIDVNKNLFINNEF